MKSLHRDERERQPIDRELGRSGQHDCQEQKRRRGAHAAAAQRHASDRDQQERRHQRPGQRLLQRVGDGIDQLHVFARDRRLREPLSDVEARQQQPRADDDRRHEPQRPPGRGSGVFRCDESHGRGGILVGH